ncbi:MAG: uroporphyrinogen decarboxylase [Magnetococcales bacterium]|nr:uroporphyrinogen decarboxylase [Magnetococcales bacterium]
MNANNVTAPSSEPQSLFLRACLGLDVAQTPVWLMRQAGRYLPEYREVRRQAGSFLALCKNPELAARVTLQPIERFGLDAAILFSDILVIPEAMGMELHFLEGEGPHFPHPLTRLADLDRLNLPDPEVQLGYVMGAIDEIRRQLPSSTPLIGFSGSPWTLATYMIEGGSSKKFAQIKTALYDDPPFLEGLLERLVTTVVHYLNAQIDHGVQAVQIFDTWGGILGPDEYRRFSLEPMTRIIAGLKRRRPDGSRVPVILFSKGCGGYLETIATSGCDVVGLDWMTPLGQARARLGPKFALQGNLDPAVLYASPKRIHAEVRRVLESLGNQNGHIFNLGHGMEPNLDPEKVPILIAAVREESKRIRGQSSTHV